MDDLIREAVKDVLMGGRARVVVEQSSSRTTAVGRVLVQRTLGDKVEWHPVGPPLIDQDVPQILRQLADLCEAG